MALQMMLKAGFDPRPVLAAHRATHAPNSDSHPSAERRVAAMEAQLCEAGRGLTQEDQAYIAELAEKWEPHFASRRGFLGIF